MGHGAMDNNNMVRLQLMTLMSLVTLRAGLELSVQSAMPAPGACLECQHTGGLSVICVNDNFGRLVRYLASAQSW